MGGTRGMKPGDWMVGLGVVIVLSLNVLCLSYVSHLYPRQSTRLLRVDLNPRVRSLPPYHILLET